MTKLIDSASQHLSEKLLVARNTQKLASIIIGAGCSVSCGIPLAAGIISIIAERYPNTYNQLPEEHRDNYRKIMNLIPPSERRDLIIDITKDKPNSWGYIALARMIEAGYINRVLSLNFDTQLQKACSLIGIHPNVYDCSHSGIKDFSLVADPSIIHLHGQSYGFRQTHDEDETRAHARRIKPLVTDTINSSLTIAIGYSGHSDALFDLIVKHFNQTNYFFWLSHEETPTPHLQPLLGKNHTKHFGAIDFDALMVNLAKKLDCWPPRILIEPIGLVKGWLSDVAQYRPSREEIPLDLGFYTKRKLDAISEEWNGKYGAFHTIERELTSLNYKNAIREYEGLQDKDRIKLSAHHARQIAWAYAEKSYQLWNSLSDWPKDNPRALEILDEAEALIMKAVEISQNEVHLSNFIAVKIKKFRITGDFHELQDAEGLFDIYDIKENIPRNLNNYIALYSEMYKIDNNKKYIERVEYAWSVLKETDASKIYNYICFCATIGQYDLCKEMLTSAKSDGYLRSNSFVYSDPELECLREFDWFNRLFADD